MKNLNFSNSENTPGLTKIWNRDYGAGRLAFEISRTARQGNHRCSILLVQIDGVSRATDRLGHASGDGLLRRVVCVLTQELGAEDLCCCLADDEFMLILPERTETETGLLVQRLRRRWMSAPQASDEPLKLSIGIARYPQQGATVEQLFAAADEDMYADKDRNRGTSLHQTILARAGATLGAS